eukprot:7883358-Lingulodinium_polyedra.AAC.1
MASERCCTCALAPALASVAMESNVQDCTSVCAFASTGICIAFALAYDHAPSLALAHVHAHSPDGACANADAHGHGQKPAHGHVYSSLV